MPRCRPWNIPIFLRPAALQNKKSPFLCGQRFLLKAPNERPRGARSKTYRSILRPRSKEDAAGALSKNAFYSDYIV